MKDSPLVSVILTSFNHAKYLRASIDSVLNQTFADYELIIWDDCSQDNSWGIINSYKDHRIKAFRNEQNMGGGNTHRALKIVSGEYIAIHHSDNVWELDKLEKQVAFLEVHAEVGAVFTNALAITEDDSPLTDENHFYFNIFDQSNRTRFEWLNFFFNRGNALCRPSVLIRKKCHEDCGHRLGFAQLPDLDKWIRLCLKYEIHVLPEKLVRFRVRDNEANASGDRPETRLRWTYEFYKLLSNYRQISSFNDLVKIFPFAVKYDRKEETDMDFVLAMVALEGRHFPFTQLFGLDLLFEIISDPVRSANIKRLYDFDDKSFKALTAQHDVFSREEVAALWGTVAERDGQIAGLNQKVTERNQAVQSLAETVAQRDALVSERDGQIAALYHSTSWRITWSYRIAGHQLKRFCRVVELTKPAIQLGGGLKNTFKKAIHIYRREGLAGIKRGLRIVATSSQTNPILNSGKYDRKD